MSEKKFSAPSLVGGREKRQATNNMRETEAVDLDLAWVSVREEMLLFYGSVSDCLSRAGITAVLRVDRNGKLPCVGCFVSSSARVLPRRLAVAHARKRLSSGRMLEPPKKENGSLGNGTTCVSLLMR